MLHPSYADLIKIANEGSVEDAPLIVSRYSIVHATAKRARQIIDKRRAAEQEENAEASSKKVKGVDKKALSEAINEIEKGTIRIIG